MLSSRLKAIAKFIESDDILMDIGCDHGYLPIALIKARVVNKAYATDNKKSALDNAITNIKKENLNKKITTILADGIDFLPDDVNTIIISGMGSHNILKILKDKKKLKKIDKLVIQSNNNLHLLRKDICKKGFYIKGERVVLDNDKYYVIIMFRKGYKRYKYTDLLFGPVLKKRNIAINYYRYLRSDYERLLKILPKHNLKQIIKVKYLIFSLSRIIHSLED